MQPRKTAEEGSLVTALTNQAQLGEKEEGESGQRNSTDKGKRGLKIQADLQGCLRAWPLSATDRQGGLDSRQGNRRSWGYEL